MANQSIIAADDFADRSKKGRLRSRLIRENALELAAKLDLAPEVLFVSKIHKGFFGKKELVALTESFDAILESIQRLFAKINKKVNIKVKYGNPVDEILSEITLLHDPYCLVMGTQGKTGIQKMILGSVAEEVLHHTHIPTVIIGPKAQEQHRVLKLGQDLQIIFLTDFGDASIEAQKVAQGLCQKLKCQVLIVHSIGGEILKIRDNLYSSGHIPFNIDNMFNQMTDDAQRRLLRSAQGWNKLGLKAEWQLFTKEEPLEKSLIKFLRGSQGLIIMGTHGRNRLTSSVIGSTARNIMLSSSWPIMVVRGKTPS